MSEKGAGEKIPDASEDPVANVNESNPGGEPQEPKNVQELTNYIQSMLQQMQDRFQTMSDQVFSWLLFQALCPLMRRSLFQIISRIDEMAGRIDDLEHNINDLMVQAGQGETTPAITSEHQKQTISFH